MPIDLLNGFPGKATKFELKYNQEFSRTASGQSLVQDMATPYWVGSWSFYQSLHPFDFEPWRAKLNSMRGSLETFYAYAPAQLPLAYIQSQRLLPDVSSVVIGAINANRTAVRTDGLPKGYIYTVGDYIQLGDSLHQIQVSGTSTIVVTPPIPSKIVVGAKVTLVKPSCIMRIVPQSLDMSIDDSGRGMVRFDGEQVL